MSGAAALLYQMYPNAKPDRIKKLLTNAAVTISGKSQAIGGGELQLQPTLTTSLPASVQTWPVSTGIGTLEGARGLDHLTSDGVVLTGEQDIFGQGFDSLVMAASEADHNSWSGGTWNGNSWSGSSWSGNSWSGNSLVGQLMVRQQLVRQQLVGQLVVRQQLVRQLLVRQQLVGQLVVRQQLVDRASWD